MHTLSLPSPSRRVGPPRVRLPASEPPLRDELFSDEQLRRHAATVAGRHQVDRRSGPNRLLLRLADNEQVLIRAYELVTRAEAEGRRIAPAGEWLLDNFYLIEEQIRMAKRHLPKGYSRELPRLLDGPSAGLPRVYDIALETISHGDGRVDVEVAAVVAAPPPGLGRHADRPV